jgi:hypothetical protein
MKYQVEDSNSGLCECGTQTAEGSFKITVFDAKEEVSSIA